MAFFILERTFALLVTRYVVTKEEIITTIRELAEKLERRPTHLEICSAMKLASGRIGKLFGSYTQAVKAAGLMPSHSGRLTLERVFEDWREIVRKLGRIPTIYQYKLESRYSERPLKHRFGSWHDIPEGMLAFGDRKGLWAGWEDVREVAQRYVEEKTTSTEAPVPMSALEEVDAHLLYGGPLTDSPMAMAPMNELGVVLLFGAMARKLGFAVLKMHPKSYPDCEGVREIAPGRWQRVRIEFEFASKNFQLHGHDAGECDLIVCWAHDWEGCPLEVLELRKAVFSS